MTFNLVMACVCSLAAILSFVGLCISAYETHKRVVGQMRDRIDDLLDENSTLRRALDEERSVK